MEHRTSWHEGDHFTLFTCLLSLMIAGLYGVRIFTEGFSVPTLIIIALNLLYVPAMLILGNRAFPYWCLIYSVLLVFLTAFTETYLFNNFTPLFIICLVIMIKPSLKIPALVLYGICAMAAFMLNKEGLLEFLLHLFRSIWFIEACSHILHERYERRQLILQDDERKILDQLAEGTIYQKEVQGFSENTVYRKLKAARERNGNLTRDELVAQYRKSKKQTATSGHHTADD